MAIEKTRFRPPWPPTTREIEHELAALLEQQSWGVYEGERTARLEQSLAQAFEQPFVYLCCSGTFAVELALRGLGIGKGDEVILSAYDFPGNFRAIEAIGARPVLVDLGPTGWAFDPEQICAAISSETRAVIASHLHGSLVDMPRLMELAQKHSLRVLEDACQCPGARVAGRPAGAWGHVSVLSFGGSKLLSAGRGGAVLTQDESVLQRLKIFAERGNLAFPLSELQAAVLLPQLGHLAERHRRRGEAVNRLLGMLDRFQDRLELPTFSETDSPAFYKVPLMLPENGSRAAALELFQEAELPIDVGFRGFARRSSARCRVVGDLQRARHASARTLLLHHPVLLAEPSVVESLGDALVSCLNRLFSPAE